MSRLGAARPLSTKLVEGRAATRFGARRVGEEP
jgi:hypothetical protein